MAWPIRRKSSVVKTSSPSETRKCHQMHTCGTVDDSRYTSKRNRPVGRGFQVARHAGQHSFCPLLGIPAHSHCNSQQFVVSQQALHNCFANKPCGTSNQNHTLTFFSYTSLPLRAAGPPVDPSASCVRTLSGQKNVHSHQADAVDLHALLPSQAPLRQDRLRLPPRKPGRHSPQK